MSTPFADALALLTPIPVQQRAARRDRDHDGTIPGGSGPDGSALDNPSPGSGAPDEQALCWFPVVGLMIGSGTGIAWRAARLRLGPLGAASVGVLADLAATGGLHLDGLADSADGLFAHAPSKQRLEIMAEPDVGAFGVLAVGSALLVRAAALAELDADTSPLLLGAIGCASRSVMALACRTLPYARPGGLAHGLVPAEPTWPDAPATAALAGLAAAIVLAAASNGGRGALSLLGGCAAGAATLALARRRLGGFTGDVLGASGVLTESVALLLCSGRRSRRAPRSRRTEPIAAAEPA